MNQKLVKKVLRVSLNVVFYTIVIALLAFSVSNISVKKDNDIANLFGVGFLSVQSDSMEGTQEHSFSEGDLIFVNILDEEGRANLQLGDVVTFYDLSVRDFNTHRIVDILEIDGEVYLSTKGDNANQADLEPLHLSNALAVHRSSISGIGNSIDYLQTSAGFALFIILPVVLFLVAEGIMLIKHVFVINKFKMEQYYAVEKEKALVTLEAEKEKIRQQVMSELKVGL
ncbi:MAG: signal peptidase I [Tenericutes bacterium GWC2_39_45]|nr:MAG: signal peptidase I [Tenericutes bacterium GWA2_38_26]OHE30506.1 MAG: signal peptidase I [Tenericutes bacterium GWC2_39_45]OHE32641.1 MAG: signal peptidase I [Tenericutes bacterium GWD2_38_27]OHE44997.1 MAG: signal peptidase I [Tenericutes bacterium GWF2_38_8]HBG33311.1 signal peptidase I [Acholeplasmataceae bacterium]